MMTKNSLATSASVTLFCLAAGLSMDIKPVHGVSLDVDMELEDYSGFEFEGLEIELNEREKRVPTFHRRPERWNALNEKTLHSYLFGYQEEVRNRFPAGEGSVNCYDDQGNEVGFFCLMRPDPSVEGGDVLKANRNADLCAANVDRDLVHCHGSPQNSLYRHVIVDHMNRGYNGRLSCQCNWPPVGHASDCDITSNDGSDRYDNGKDGICPIEDAIPRIPTESWGSPAWGNLYICDEVGSTDCEDFKKFQDFVEKLGLGDGTGTRAQTSQIAFTRVDGCQTKVTKAPTPSGGCITTTQYCNGLRSTMTSNNPCA